LKINKKKILPDYRIKKEIIIHLDEILSDLTFYKNSKNLILTVENLEKFTKTDTIAFFFESLKIQIESLPENDLRKVNSILFAFLEKNKKKYLNKTTTSEWAVYEYDSHYLWYITDKKIKIVDTYNFLFKNKTIESIYIDGIKRSYLDFNENCLNDILYANKVKIKIYK
jgi:hypothetical protein